MEFPTLSSKQGLAIVAGLAIALLIVAYFVSKKKTTRRSSEGFQTVPSKNSTIPEDLLKNIEPCKVMNNLLINIDGQIKAAESGTTAPGQIELLKLTRGSIQQQLQASNCT